MGSDDGDTFFILMLDNFTAHFSKVVQEELLQLSTFLIDVPASTTSQLQMLDVGIIKPFKGYMRDFEMEWMIETRSVGRITRELVSKWVCDSWDQIPKEMTVNTARHIGFYDDESIC